jgi:hypothetical protein
LSDKHGNSRASDRSRAASPSSNEVDDELLLYANDVRVVVDAGGVHLIFSRSQPLETVPDELTQRSDVGQPENEVIARVVLPPPAARRLLRILPPHLADRSERPVLAPNESAHLEDDPFLAALAAAELDDEPYTDEQRAAALAGWEACKRGETVPWEDVRRSLLDEEEAPKISLS